MTASIPTAASPFELPVTDAARALCPGLGAIAIRLARSPDSVAADPDWSALRARWFGWSKADVLSLPEVAPLRWARTRTSRSPEGVASAGRVLSSVSPDGESVVCA